MLAKILVLSIISLTIVNSVFGSTEEDVTKLTEKVIEEILESQKTDIPESNEDTSGFKFTERVFTAQDQNLPSRDTFNRPEGTEAIIFPTPNNQRPFKIRTSGQYGSYRKQRGWQQAVADDRMRNMFRDTEKVKLRLPWLMRNLQMPTSKGFGLNGFWNSYAAPDPLQQMVGFRRMVSYEVLNISASAISSSSGVISHISV